MDRGICLVLHVKLQILKYDMISCHRLIPYFTMLWTFFHVVRVGYGQVKRCKWLNDGGEEQDCDDDDNDDDVYYDDTVIVD